MSTKKSESPEELTESDLAQDKMGDNDLQGDDQANVRNQRHDQPDTKKETDGVIESFRKMDDDYRARKDLGKGNKEDE